jgi:hypothetical protein
MQDVEVKTLIWTSYLRFIATVEIAITSVSQMSSEKYRGIGDTLKSMASHLDSNQKRELEGFISNFAGMLSAALKSREPGERAISFSEIEDPLARAAAIQFTIRSIDATMRDPDRFHIEAAAVSLVSAFELLSTDLAHQIFVAHPAAIPGDPSVSLTTLSKARSIESIINSVARDKARELLMAPVDEWLAQLAKHCRVSLPKRIEDWPEEIRYLCWFAACRNSIVHIGGKVDDKLINRARRLGIHHAEIPKNISFTQADIVRDALNMARVGTLLMSGARINLTDKNSREKEALENNRSIALLQLSTAERGHAQLAEAIGEARQDGLTTDEVTLDHIAHWTAMVSAGKRTEVNQIARQANWPEDSTARLHKAALTGELDAMDEAFRIAFEDGLTLVDVLYDPEFQIVRKYLK